MTIEEFVLKYNLEPIAKVKRIMPAGIWGETKLDDVVSVSDKDWLVSNFCQISLASFENLLTLATPQNRFHLAQQWEQQQEEYLILLGFHP